MGKRRNGRNDQKTAKKVRPLTIAFVSRALSAFGKPIYYTIVGILAFIVRISEIFPDPKKTSDLASKLLKKFARLYLRWSNKIKRLFEKIKLVRLRSEILKAMRKKKGKLATRKKTAPKRFPTGKLYRVLIVAGIITTAFAIFVASIPSADELLTRKQLISTKIYDRNGILLYTIFKDENRTPIPLSEIPQSVRLATLAIEDAEFYSHPGFSVRGMSRAFVRNITRGELTGGSTITQQLVKNALLSPEKTAIRKLKEIVLAVKVEARFTKDEILEMYLNEVSYGGTAYGIKEAANVYFDKEPKELSLAEAALLAGLPKSPTRFSPFGPNPDLAKLRQSEVINLMLINRYIDEQTAEEALKERITFAENKTEILAPHFVMYVREALEEKYGKEIVEQGGLIVNTSLDYNIQRIAEEVISSEIEKVRSLNVSNAAAVVLDPKTGEVLAMVGSVDYFDTKRDGNVNVTTALRQPGSAIKIINYALALAKNFTPATIIPDKPITFNVEGQPPYTPKNYDGNFRGNITLRSALAESRNIPAVRVLAQVGLENFIDLGRKLGITTWTDPSDYGLSLTLGGGEVKLLELARVYSVFANSGYLSRLVSVHSVSDFRGNILKLPDCVSGSFVKSVDAAEAKTMDCGKKVLDERIAFLITDILRDNTARRPSFGENSQLVIRNHPEVAVKTGTSNNLRDNLTVGYTEDFVVAVWVGNNDGSSMARVSSGLTGAAPIFNKIMSALLNEKESKKWQVPDAVVQLPICSITGTLPCDGCPTKMEWFLEENVPTTHCGTEAINKINEEKLLDSPVTTER